MLRKKINLKLFCGFLHNISQWYFNTKYRKYIAHLSIRECGSWKLIKKSRFWKIVFSPSKNSNENSPRIKEYTGERSQWYISLYRFIIVKQMGLCLFSLLQYLFSDTYSLEENLHYERRCFGFSFEEFSESTLVVFHLRRLVIAKMTSFEFLFVIGCHLKAFLPDM